MATPKQMTPEQQELQKKQAAFNELMTKYYPSEERSKIESFVNKVNISISSPKDKALNLEHAREVLAKNPTAAALEADYKNNVNAWKTSVTAQQKAQLPARVEKAREPTVPVRTEKSQRDTWKEEAAAMTKAEIAAALELKAAKGRGSYKDYEFLDGIYGSKDAKKIILVQTLYNKLVEDEEIEGKLLKVDGVYGKATKEAVRKMQAAAMEKADVKKGDVLDEGKGIRLEKIKDGVFGIETLLLLKKAYSKEEEEAEPEEEERTPIVKGPEAKGKEKGGEEKEATVKKKGEEEEEKEPEERTEEKEEEGVPIAKAVEKAREVKDEKLAGNLEALEKDVQEAKEEIEANVQRTETVTQESPRKWYHWIPVVGEVMDILEGRGSIWYKIPVVGWLVNLFSSSTTTKVEKNRDAEKIQEEINAKLKAALPELVANNSLKESGMTILLDNQNQLRVLQKEEESE